MEQKRIKRNYCLKVRYTFSELALIKQKAKETGLTTARYIRETSLDNPIRVKRFTQEEKEQFRVLTGMANNMNQITKRYHVGDTTHLALIRTVSSIEELIKKMLRDDREDQNR